MPKVNGSDFGPKRTVSALPSEAIAPVRSNEAGVTLCTLRVPGAGIACARRIAPRHTEKVTRGKRKRVKAIPSREIGRARNCRKPGKYRRLGKRAQITRV